MSDSYFGEGLARFGDRLYQITWLTNEGFIYSIPDLKQVWMQVFDAHSSIKEQQHTAASWQWARVVHHSVQLQRCLLAGLLLAP